MVFSGERGTLFDSSADFEFDMGRVESEDVSLKAGLFRKQFPLQAADNAAFESIFGSTRVIIIRGVKFGTQAAIESFMKQFTDRADGGFQSTTRYFPLFHQDNTLAASNKQDAFFKVLFNDFTYRAELTRVGFAIDWETELFEGDRILEFLIGEE